METKDSVFLVQIEGFLRPLVLPIYDLLDLLHARRPGDEYGDCSPNLAHVKVGPQCMFVDTFYS